MGITIHPNGLVTGGTIRAAGNVIQVVQASKTGSRQISANSTWTDVGLQVTITPKASNSLIYLLLTARAGNDTSSSNGIRVIKDGATVIMGGNDYLHNYAYNIGGNNEIKNIDIVLIICKLMDKIKPRKDKKPFSDLIQYVEDRPGHDFRYAIDANKIKSKLGWTPSESFQSGIKKTIEWYLNNQEWLESIYDNTYRQSRLGILRK